MRENRNGLQDLQRAVLNTLNAILDETLHHAGVAARSVYEIVAAGNSTMQQILCGCDCGALGELPFVPVFDEGRRCPAAALGLRANPAAELYLFPRSAGSLAAIPWPAS